ncbi:hypothetical protein, partial [Alkalicoccus luteus]|uniref:hypothetical protein n=1 Tax=Alkalicoccus luteus TaxID=1237094 RepID=UPI00197B2AA7
SYRCVSFAFFGGYVDVLASLFDIEALPNERFHPYGTSSCEPSPGFQPDSQLPNRRASTPGGSERGEDPALPTAGG